MSIDPCCFCNDCTIQYMYSRAVYKIVLYINVLSQCTLYMILLYSTYTLELCVWRLCSIIFPTYPPWGRIEFVNSEYQVNLTSQCSEPIRKFVRGGGEICCASFSSNTLALQCCVETFLCSLYNDGGSSTIYTFAKARIFV